MAFARDFTQPDGGSLFKLCAEEIGGQPFCFSNFSGLSEGTSVSDAGEVLYMFELEKSCGPVSCMGIKYWRPGMSKGEVIENEDSYDAQWITPATAARLHEWNTHMLQGAAKPN
jgi:hypothetical protein